MHASLHTRQASDRRKYPRTPVNGAIDLRASGIEIPITANLHDISPGGCQIECRVTLPVKHALRLLLPLPGSSPIVVDANIVRSDAIASQKVNRYGVRFRVETAALRDNLVTYISRYCTPRRPDATHERRVRGSIDARFPVTLSTAELRAFNAMGLSLSTEGVRVASDRVLRQEWLVKLELKLPGSMGQTMLHLMGRPKPGAKSVRGSYVQDVVFVETSLAAIAQIEKAVAEVARTTQRAS